jgi:hypothetical protein
MEATRCQGWPNSLCGASPPQPIEHVRFFRQIHHHITYFSIILKQKAASMQKEFILLNLMTVYQNKLS